MVKLTRLMQIHGSKRKRGTIRIRPIKPKLKEKRELQAIINEMVHAIFAHADALVAAATKDQPTLQTMDGQIIGIMKDSIDDIDRLIELIVLQTQQAMARIQVRVRGWSTKVEERHREEFSKGVLTATGINMATVLDPSSVSGTVGHYVTWSTSLIRDVGDEARRRIANAVLEGVRQRTPVRELAKTIQELEPMSLRRARNIASDQTTKLNNALDRARQQEAGIDAFTWIHSGAAHPREWHADRDGEVFAWDTDEIDTGDFPGEPPFCGCVAQATLVLEDGQTVDTGEDVTGGEE
jgi:SPP1 gp7 family putative phage head morphogenesis protein